jgi:SAM-dependent methyltransferase
MAEIAPANEEVHEAWNGVLFDRFVEYRDVIVDGLGAHGEAALRLHPPSTGDRVLDIGCGFGDTAQRIASMVGPEGTVKGVDVAERFIELAREEADAAGAENVSFEVADVEVAELGQEYDYAFSRFGTQFFANPGAAMRRVRAALRPGGRLCMVVWRRKLDNDWLHRAELVVKDFVDEPEESDEPTCGPGPFSMANADTVSDILLGAGFEDVTFSRCDTEFRFGSDLDSGVSLMTALGPAGEVIRLAGDDAERVRPAFEASLREALAGFVREDGIYANASTWIVSARAPSA